MFKKILLGIAALGLTTSVPAQARPEFGVTIELGSKNHRNYEYNRRGYREYNNYPQCRRNEVLVQERRYPHRVYCISKREYKNYYGNHYGWQNDPRRDYRY